jgi:hypothetical protein
LLYGSDRPVIDPPFSRAFAVLGTGAVAALGLAGRRATPPLAAPEQAVAGEAVAGEVVAA